MSTSAGNGSPAALIAEARAGSPDALSALYLEHGAALFRLAYLRAVLVLKEIEGYAHAEIALLLGISEGASRVRLTRALERLRNELEGGR